MPSQHLADLIRATVRAHPDHPCDPEELAYLLGYRVFWTDPSEMGWAEGMIVRDELHVARSGFSARDRWTLAHELAHAEARKRGLPWRDERLADGCAAELLLPSALIARHLRAGLDLPLIASTCRVSREAAARRVVEVVPGLAVTAYLNEARLYSSLASPSRRLSRLARGLAFRCRSRGRSKRIHLPSWVASGWSGPDPRMGVAVILRR